MADAPTTTDPILAAIEAKIAAWTAVADSYRAAMAIDAPLGDAAGLPASPAAAVKPAARPRTESELPVGVFRNHSIKDAITLYLQSCNGKRTNKEIAVALQKGGIGTTSKHFEPTVGTALHRMKAEGLLLRFPDGWDLASHYPENLRHRLGRDEKNRKPAKAKKRKVRTKAAKPANTGPLLLPPAEQG